MYLISSF